jgi:hypothetical protein
MGTEGSSIVGTWDFAVNTPMGDVVISVEFADEHSGVARYGDIEVPLRDIVVSGSTVTCTVSVTEPTTVTLSCTVQVTGDTFTGTASAGFFGKFAVAGRRTSY